jgi:hypothetical protein
MKQYFEKIDVKTLDSLPNKDVIIYAKCKNSVTLENIEFHKDDLQWGIQNIEWYLIPVSKEELQDEICLYPRITTK